LFGRGLSLSGSWLRCDVVRPPGRALVGGAGCCETRMLALRNSERIRESSLCAEPVCEGRLITLVSHLRQFGTSPMDSNRSRFGMLIGLAAAAGAFGVAVMMSAVTAPTARADDFSDVISAVDGDYTGVAASF